MADRHVAREVIGPVGDLRAGVRRRGEEHQGEGQRRRVQPMLPTDGEEQHRRAGRGDPERAVPGDERRIVVAPPRQQPAEGGRDDCGGRGDRKDQRALVRADGRQPRQPRRTRGKPGDFQDAEQEEDPDGKVDPDRMKMAKKCSEFVHGALPAQANIPRAILPLTSVSRKSRPWNR